VPTSLRAIQRLTLDVCLFDLRRLVPLPADQPR
jgi:hypothetical protein